MTHPKHSLLSPFRNLLFGLGLCPESRCQVKPFDLTARHSRLPYPHPCFVQEEKTNENKTYTMVLGMLDLTRVTLLKEIAVSTAQGNFFHSNRKVSTCAHKIDTTAIKVATVSPLSFPEPPASQVDSP